jgi:hypothetical protein
MIKSLLSKTFTILAFIFISSNSFAQQLDLNGDVIGMPGKTSPNNTMAYTPCPTLSGIDTTKNAYFCNTLTLGYSTMTAMGGPSPFSYSWFQTIGYTPIGLPAFTSTYSSSQARGFWFTSPTNTVITGLRVPTDIGTANQFVYVVKWSSVPPTYPALGSNYTVLGKFLDVPGLDTIKCGIAIKTGDIIGVLGVRGSTTSATGSMSYGNGGFATTISGFPVTLYRFMDQTDITTNPLGQLTEGGSGSIGRVDMFFGNSISLVSFANNLNGGNYVCFYADTNGCTKSSTVTVTAAATIIATSSFTNPTCAAGNNGQAFVLPSGGYFPYSYSWSPTGGTSNTATGLSVGSYTCLITDSLGNCTSKVVNLGTCTGLNELNKNNNVSIYPNPSSGKFFIQAGSRSEIQIYNALGSVIYNGKLEEGSNTINLNEQADGIYYIRIKENTDQAYYKIIKN